jgi:hypothetical protein
MTSLRRLALTLSIAAFFAVPAVAHAGVGGQISNASDALGEAVRAAKQGNVPAFRAAARANRTATATAVRKARKARGKARRAKLMRQVAGHSDRSIDKFAGLIDVVPVEIQALVVDNLEVSAAMRERLVEMLLGLAETLPEPARTQVIEAITQFQTDGEIEALFEALASEEVLNSVKEMIAAQIEAISAQLDDVLSHLEGLTGVLPPGAGAGIEQAISMIEGHLAHIGDLIGGLLDGFGGGGGGFLGGGLFGGLLGGGPLCDLLGGFVPICD